MTTQAQGLGVYFLNNVKVMVQLIWFVVCPDTIVFAKRKGLKILRRTFFEHSNLQVITFLHRPSFCAIRKNG